MRRSRGAGEPMLAVDPAPAPAFSRVDRSPRGLRLVAEAPPQGSATAPEADLMLESGAPVPLRAAALVAGGTQVFGLSARAEVVYSLALPRIRVVHDRRPPGVDALVGAASVNAGLLHAADGWRVVVLPSLGDVAANLGDGPIALRADGRMLALIADGRLVELPPGGAQEPESRPGDADLLAYSGDGGLWVAVGAAVGPPGTARVAGSPVVALSGASVAPRVAALHADGTVALWQTGQEAPLARWRAPEDAAQTIRLSADGERVELGCPAGDHPAACIARASDGALVRRVVGARVLTATPDGGGALVAGDWGCAWLITIPDATE